jgi:hypothetical protein
MTGEEPEAARVIRCEVEIDTYTETFRCPDVP